MVEDAGFLVPKASPDMQLRQFRRRAVKLIQIIIVKISNSNLTSSLIISSSLTNKIHTNRINRNKVVHAIILTLTIFRLRLIMVMMLINITFRRPTTELNLIIKVLRKNIDKTQDFTSMLT